MAEDKKGLDLKNPGGKEILIAGGIAVVLGVIYLKLNANKTAAGGAGVPASGHGLGSVPGPQLQTFFPGGGSASGNALTDSLFTTPATPSPGVQPVTLPTVTGINGNVPTIDRSGGGGGIGGRPPGPRIGHVDTPVQHVQMGAESILGSGATLTPVSIPGSATTTAAPAVGLAGQWQGGSLFNSPVSPVAWADSILRDLKAPFTTANRQSLIAWALNEGGGGSYNPLNTTQGSQYPAFNGIGVRNFPNWAVGASETAQTIQNGYYPNIWQGLVSGKGIGPNAGSELHTWSGANGYTGIAGTWARAGSIVAAVEAQQAAAARKAAAAAAKVIKLPTAAQIANLFPRVKPANRNRPHSPPARRAPARPAYHAVGSIGAALARFAATFRPKPAPAPKPLTQAPHHQRFVGGY